MPDEIWVSTVGSNSRLFDKPGIREKHYGQDWAPPKFEKSALAETQYQNVLKHSRDEKLEREDFAEAAYVFDPKRWSRVKDFFAVDGFICVKGKLAELLKEFDFGDGELVEFPIYEMDKTTRLPGESKKAKLLARKKETGVEIWERPIEPSDGDVAVSGSALDDADLWVDPKLYSALFMSGQLHDAIEAAKLGIDFRFSRARIV
ncbi:hypothetical protein [Stappia stellulata]|uniref:hypothetical protein n=1 Tax=Stappia stellulata TaxID=71235 RepID=UPI000425274D|nr:hypothetical protein [Stappia stellulata]